MLEKAIAGMRRWSFLVEDICSGGEFHNWAIVFAASL